MEGNKYAVWRLQTNIGIDNIGKYCLDHNVAALGWGLGDNIGKKEKTELSFEEYCIYADDLFDSYDSVIRMHNDAKMNDLIWMKVEGKYYIARIKESSKWVYNTSGGINNDGCNQLTNIFWIHVGDESQVPGALTTSFIRGSAFQRIWKPGVLEFSEMIYDAISNDLFKYNMRIELNKETFYSLISPSDCEDLLYSYLYKISDKNFLCIPSTNKINTEKYEFVVLDAITGKHIYVQVKNGAVDIDANDYKDLLDSQRHQSEIYLLTTGGNVLHAEDNNNIHIIDPNELFDFACADENANILPPNIKHWIEFAVGCTLFDGKKGIMFDTNDDICEKYMFEHNVIAAWGAPKRYIDSFNGDDYVLYYKKGCGIIAIGKILDNIARDIEDDDRRELPVELIVKPKLDSEKKLISIQASEIRVLLGKRFFYASTRKVPFLNEKETIIILNELKKKQKSV